MISGQIVVMSSHMNFSCKSIYGCSDVTLLWFTGGNCACLTRFSPRTSRSVNVSLFTLHLTSSFAAMITVRPLEVTILFFLMSDKQMHKIFQNKSPLCRLVVVKKQTAKEIIYLQSLLSHSRASEIREK